MKAVVVIGSVFVLGLTAWCAVEGTVAWCIDRFARR